MASLGVSYSFYTDHVADLAQADATRAAEVAAAQEALAARDAELRDSFAGVAEAAFARFEAGIAAFAPLRPDEHRALTATPYHQHLSASRQVGVPLGRTRWLKRVPEGSPYYVTGWDGLLSEEAIATLDRIGRRFREACLAEGLPPARFIVTSTYRSAADQEELRKENVNATLGQSSHEFGGSFDIAYEKFLPALETEAPLGLYEVEAGVPPRLLSQVQADAVAREATWAPTVPARFPAAYDAVLARVLIDLEAEGRVHALREYRQTCFHVTARRMPRV